MRERLKLSKIVFIVPERSCQHNHRNTSQLNSHSGTAVFSSTAPHSTAIQEERKRQWASFTNNVHRNVLTLCTMADYDTCTRANFVCTTLQMLVNEPLILYIRTSVCLVLVSTRSWRVCNTDVAGFLEWAGIIVWFSVGRQALLI